MLRWGILGPGNIAAKRVAPAMRAAGHDLACIGSRSLTRAQAFAANHGVRRARGSYAEVLEADDVDAVYVSLPNDVHEEWTIAALEAGKHVLCEKPLSLDAASAGRMAASSAEHGRLLMEAGMWRFHPRTAATFEVLRERRIGDLRLVHAAFAFRMRNAENYRALLQHGGGALLDIGYYGVTAARWFAGDEPDAVRAVQRRWPGGVDGTTFALLSFPAGATASIQASFDSARHEVVDLVGTDGTLRLPRTFTAHADFDAPLLVDGEPLATWRADPYREMVAAFADAVAGGGPAPLPLDDSVATAEVLDRIRTAAI